MKYSNANKYKEASKNNWRNAPCGSNLVDIKDYIYLSKEYFDELEKQKRKEEPWKIQEFKKMNIKTCELKVCNTKKPWNPTVLLAHSAFLELSVLYIIRAFVLKGGKNVAGNSA